MADRKKVGQGLMEALGMLMPEPVKRGAKAAIDLMDEAARREVRDEKGNRILSAVSNYSIFSPKYREELEKIKGITLGGTPGEFLGAYATRLLTDVGSDSSRHIYWRYNHPMAIADAVIEKVAGESYRDLDPTRRAALGLAVGGPMAVSLGNLDITNPGEAFRAKGFAQSYAEPGSDDRRQTAQPGIELAERVVLGRQGRPLKYETAKQDIPDLTKERYSNYMRNYYQDKGVTGMGLVKFTSENLEGVPEARIVGFPIGLQAVGAGVGGATALRHAMKTMPKDRTIVNRPSQKGKPAETEVKTTPAPGATRRSLAITAAGSAVGLAAGALMNKLIAEANRPKLEELSDYQAGM